MGDPKRGLYAKYNITRTDNSDTPGGKHHGCDYFALDLTHDKHALSALRAYATSCREEFPLLAADLDAKADAMRQAMPDAKDPAALLSRVRAYALDDAIGAINDLSAGLSWNENGSLMSSDDNDVYRGYEQAIAAIEKLKTGSAA